MSAPLSVPVLLELYYYSSRAGCCNFDATVLSEIPLTASLQVPTSSLIIRCRTASAPPTTRPPGCASPRAPAS
eukprot:scaffold41065_cov80-Phaeocystis_antarctica.AAC.3